MCTLNSQEVRVSVGRGEVDEGMNGLKKGRNLKFKIFRNLYFSKDVSDQVRFILSGRKDKTIYAIALLKLTKLLTLYRRLS